MDGTHHFLSSFFAIERRLLNSIYIISSLTGHLGVLPRVRGAIRPMGLWTRPLLHDVGSVDRMAANLVLFDDLGTLWDGGSPRLRTSYGAPHAADEFSTYVVKNLGFIAVHLYGRSCEIRVRPRLVKPEAFRGLKAWLTTQTLERIVTVQYKDDWVYSMHADKQAALERIEQTLAREQAPRPGDYLVRQITPLDLPKTTPQHQALHSLIKNWPMLSQSVHKDGLWDIIRTSLQGRYHLIDARPDNGLLTFREIGHGFVSYSKDWVAGAIGTAICEQEDRAYGSWISETYRNALQHDHPVICDVDSIVNSASLGRTRLRYKRVLLPARGMGGGTWLLNSSILDPSIDLRLDLLQKPA